MRIWAGTGYVTSIRWVMLAAAVALTAQGCRGDSVVGPRPPVDIVFVTIVQGEYWSWAQSDSSAATVALLADAGSWSSFWRGSSRDTAESAPPPSVDFEHEEVLVLLDRVESEPTAIEID